MKTWQKLFTIAILVFFFGGLFLFVHLANSGRVDLVEKIGVYLGIFGIILGTGFILYLLRKLSKNTES